VNRMLGNTVNRLLVFIVILVALALTARVWG
jgi:hypothetical protein